MNRAIQRKKDYIRILAQEEAIVEERERMIEEARAKTHQSLLRKRKAAEALDDNKSDENDSSDSDDSGSDSSEDKVYEVNFNPLQQKQKKKSSNKNNAKPANIRKKVKRS